VKLEAKRGDRGAVTEAAPRFLRAWGHADRALPEVAEAERALGALSAQ